MQDLRRRTKVDDGNILIQGEIHQDHIKKENVVHRESKQQIKFSKDKNEL
jgi:hypothetical protein